jgi:hypothetical protein
MPLLSIFRFVFTVLSWLVLAGVRQAAYLLWEQDGRPDGRETEYWFRALEQELAAREATSAPADQRLNH